jgi:hypothetical protein
MDPFAVFSNFIRSFFGSIGWPKKISRLGPAKSPITAGPAGQPDRHPSGASMR